MGRVREADLDLMTVVMKLRALKGDAPSQELLAELNEAFAVVERTAATQEERAALAREAGLKEEAASAVRSNEWARAAETMIAAAISAIEAAPRGDKDEDAA